MLKVIVKFSVEYILYHKQEMLNKIPHQIDQLNCCPRQYPCYPVKQIEFLLGKYMTLTKAPGMRKIKSVFKKGLDLQCFQELCSSTLRNSSKAVNKFLLSHTNAGITAYRKTDFILQRKGRSSFKKIVIAAHEAYVIVTIPFSLSVWIRISRSAAPFKRSGCVTLRNRSLSKASLALLWT